MEERGIVDTEVPSAEIGTPEPAGPETQTLPGLSSHGQVEAEQEGEFGRFMGDQERTLEAATTR